MQVLDWLSGSLDWGYPLQDGPNTRKHDPRLNFNLRASFWARTQPHSSRSPDHATFTDVPTDRAGRPGAGGRQHAGGRPTGNTASRITVDTTPQRRRWAAPPARSPLLVRLHTGNFTFDGISEKGADIRFVAADDQTVLNHQLEAFDPLLGIALIWVDVPELADSQRRDAGCTTATRRPRPRPTAS